jgi:predicted dehydrogenase
VIGSTGIARRRTIPEGLVSAANAQLVSVFGRNRAENERVASDFGARAADTVDALLQEDIDAVYVATPPHLHLEDVIACAKAGKHVLCEKPFAPTVSEAREIVRVCRDANVILGSAFMMRFHVMHQAALVHLKSGSIGRPVFARAQLSCWYPPAPNLWRQDPLLAGGGALMDLGGHCIDLLEMFFGRTIAVSCITKYTVHDYQVEDGAIVILEFENGALGIVDVFFCIADAGSRNALELYGTEGSILASGTLGQGGGGEMWLRRSQGAQAYDAQQVRADVAPEAIMPSSKNLYCAEIEAFSEAVLGNTGLLLNADLACRSQSILSACYASARLQRRISIA